MNEEQVVTRKTRCKLRPGAVWPDPVRLARTGWGKRYTSSNSRSRGCHKCAHANPEPEQAQQELPQVPAQPSDFVRDNLALNLDPWQTEIIDDPAKRKAILGARQCGKSTVIAALATHRILTKPETQIVIVAASRRQSAILVDKCKWMLRKLGVTSFRRDGINPSSIRLHNGSTIIGLPCSAPTIRGFSANLLIIDEAAFVPDVVYAAARPMLAATNGDLVVMGTADEPVGFFWRIMTAQDSPWRRTVIRASEIPRFSPDFLAEERIELGEDTYAREYECEFADHGQGMFQRRIVVRALKKDLPPLQLPKPR